MYPVSADSQALESSATGSGTGSVYIQMTKRFPSPQRSFHLTAQKTSDCAISIMCNERKTNRCQDLIYTSISYIRGSDDSWPFSVSVDVWMNNNKQMVCADKKTFPPMYNWISSHANYSSINLLYSRFGLRLLEIILLTLMENIQREQCIGAYYIIWGSAPLTKCESGSYSIQKIIFQWPRE